jgi:hypothetical protein
VIATKDHYTTTSCSSGKTRTCSTTHHWDLYDAEGLDCSVDRKTWKAARVGDAFKCMNLYGWD